MPSVSRLGHTSAHSAGNLSVCCLRVCCNSVSFVYDTSQGFFLPAGVCCALLWKQWWKYSEVDFRNNGSVYALHHIWLAKLNFHLTKICSPLIFTYECIGTTVHHYKHNISYVVASTPVCFHSWLKKQIYSDQISLYSFKMKVVPQLFKFKFHASVLACLWNLWV